MDWSSMVLATAGVFGGGTAVAHGILMKRVIMKPMETVLKRMGEYLRRCEGLGRCFYISAHSTGYSAGSFDCSRDLVRAGGKARDGPASRQFFSVRCNHLILGNASPSSQLDLDDCCARSDRLGTNAAIGSSI